MPKVVCLDPGHGVNTPGKRSPDGTLREYEFAGDVAARAKRLLEAHGLKVVLTRPCTADAKDVSLSKRVQVANDAGAAVFVSIHSNAHGNGNEWTNGRGYETYVYAYGGQAEKLARRLVDEAQRLIVPFGVPLRNPTVKAEAFYVLKYTRMPAVLIEHAFHTNKEECALLKRDDFRQACAEHIARAVCAHLGIRYDQPVVAPQSAAAGKPVLRRGDKNQAVRELQEALKELGHDPGPIDGIFGERTEAAVKAFQKAARIAVDGVVGPQTWGAIEAALAARQEAKPAPKPEPKPAPAPKPEPQAAPQPAPKPAQAPGPFKDIPADDPDADTFERLKKAGIIQGYPDGTVRPEETITMRRLAKVLDRVIQRQG